MQKRGGFKTLLVILLLSVTNFVGLFALILYFATKKYKPNLRKSVWKWMSAGQNDLSESPRNVNQDSSGEFSEFELGDVSRKIERLNRSRRLSKSQEISRKMELAKSLEHPSVSVARNTHVKRATRVPPLSSRAIAEVTKSLIAFTGTNEDIPGLNDRQSNILNYIKSRKQANMKDINLNFKSVSQRTLRRDMERLEKFRYVKQSGKTRDSMYEYIS